MNNTRKNTFFLFFILLLLLVTVGYQFQQQIKIMNQPPSKKWGKEAYLSEGKISENMRLTKYGEYYAALYNDGNNFKLLLFDSLGNIVKEKLIEIKDNNVNSINKSLIFDGSMKFILDFSLNIKDNYLYVIANLNDTLGSYLSIYKLDNNLEILDSSRLTSIEIKDFYPIDENVFFTSSFSEIDSSGYDKINIHDSNTDIIKSTDIPSNYENLMGIKIENGYAIVYHDDVNFYYCTYINGEFNESKAFFEYRKSTTFGYNNLVLASDKNNLYLMFDKEKKGEYMSTSIAQVNLKNETITKFKFTNLHKENVKGFYSENGARYVYTSPYDNQVVDLIIKDGQIVEINNVSRLEPANTYADVYDNMAVFAKYESPNFYKVYVSSTEEEYKNKNNILRKVDFKMAVTRELEGLITVITYIFTLGAVCILPMLAAVSVFSLISFRIVKKNKIKLYIIFSVTGILFKTYMMYYFIYSSNIIYYGIFTNFILGILVSIIIGLSIYSNFIYRYCKDTVGIFMVRFFPPLLLDTIVTLILFVPFTI